VVVFILENIAVRKVLETVASLPKTMKPVAFAHHHLI